LARFQNLFRGLDVVLAVYQNLFQKKIDSAQFLYIYKKDKLFFLSFILST
jgi:hypothetical protein